MAAACSRRPAHERSGLALVAPRSPADAGAGVVPLSLSLNSAASGSSDGDWTAPLRFVYYDVSVTSLSPLAGAAHLASFAVLASGLDLAVYSAQLTSFGSPMVEALKLTRAEVPARESPARHEPLASALRCRSSKWK